MSSTLAYRMEPGVMTKDVCISLLVAVNVVAGELVLV